MRAAWQHSIALHLLALVATLRPLAAQVPATWKFIGHKKHLCRRHLILNCWSHNGDGGVLTFLCWWCFCSCYCVDKSFALAIGVRSGAVLRRHILKLLCFSLLQTFHALLLHYANITTTTAITCVAVLKVITTEVLGAVCCCNSIKLYVIFYGSDRDTAWRRGRRGNARNCSNKNVVGGWRRVKLWQQDFFIEIVVL